MTEDEAKDKICCGPRNTGPDRTTSDRGCIGSACMAWEWSEPKRTAAFLEAVQARMQAQPKPNFNVALQEVYAETGGKFARVEGDCGLKRAPQ